MMRHGPARPHEPTVPAMALWSLDQEDADTGFTRQKAVGFAWSRGGVQEVA